MRRIATAALAAVALVGGVAAATTPAEAQPYGYGHHWRNHGYGYGPHWRHRGYGYYSPHDGYGWRRHAYWRHRHFCRYHYC